MLDGDRNHPLFPNAFRWELVEFTYRKHPTDWQETYIDLVFATTEGERRFRFFAPRNLEIRSGPSNVWGMRVLDVTGRQMEGIRVRVDNYEEYSGAPRFWAADVVEVTDDGEVS